ncbi:MCE family protein [Nocardioides marinus]|uniref:Phospholipid/cholesterol/gamma-HCH transport system substrate-binding protein n=1 Tax=Nocardioides marinus TaxID=374514 RepID=A0A7Y9YDZ7_9ACTN|nr:MCE family protein [Nocardioides marinus]NYI08795.1 phospholipid/cholesterol/gamma-HCH transport system substrate-binding protein [Nocardioides marinus]
MSAATSFLRRLVVPVVLLALVVVAAFTLFGEEERKTLTASFPRTVSVYEGSDVRVLGVPVGTVDTVTPSGTEVVVTMSYDPEVQIPADAKAVIIAPSIVGDRFIQLTPAYTGGEVLASGEVIGVDRTATPLELDDIYDSLDDLNVALGPNGANENGALTDLLEVTADNFGGQGARFNQTISDFGDLSATLDDNKEELFSSLTEVQAFVSTLAENDTTVRQFNTSLADVSELLSGERQELVASLDNLGTALGQVKDFVETNQDVLGRDITKLNRVAKVLVKQRANLEEVLAVAPLALNNLYLTYNPQAGTLDTNANVGNLENQLINDPGLLLCTVVNSIDPTGALCDLVQGAAPRPAALAGSASVAPQVADPTLGGLVEVTR